MANTRIKQESPTNNLNSTNLLEVIKQEVILNESEIEENTSWSDLFEQNIKTELAEEASCEEIKDELYYVILNNTYRCTICPFGTKTLTKIKDHFTEHNYNRSRVSEAPHRIEAKELKAQLKDYLYEYCDTFFQCRVCEFRSFGHEAIKQHVNRFHINVTNRCEVCNKSFVSALLLKVGNHHDRITIQYKCLKCEYTSFEPLDNHMEIHPKKCSECDVRCPKPFTKQMNNSTTDSVYYCSVCNLKFELISSWYKHSSCHRKEHARAIPILKSSHYEYKCHEKRFQCKSCEFSRSDYSTMKKHIDRVHLHIKHHQCEICGKTFFCSIGLARHIRTHTHIHEKLFKCSVCYYATTERHYLFIHMKKKHASAVL